MTGSWWRARSPNSARADSSAPPPPHPRARGRGGARPDDDLAPRFITHRQTRYLEVAEPIGDGNGGVVRVGIDMSVPEAAERATGALIASLMVPMVLAGLLAAFALGRSVGHPIRALIAAIDRLEPGDEAGFLRRGGGVDEFAGLTERLNRMLVRFESERKERIHARDKQPATERMAALGALVAGVAHEINNPLAGMKNCLRRLQRDEEASPDPKRREYLELIEEGLLRIERTVRQLLDYARPGPMHLAPVSLLELVEAGTAFMQPMLSRREIELRVDGPATMRVIADRRQIGQALLNLLLNAAYVTADGGVIKVRVRERPGAVGIAVEDEGPGIPVEIRGRVMDPYFSTKPEGEGTGLGLPVTRSIVEANGGDLTLEFPTRGTVATIWLLPEASPAARGGLTAD